MKCPKNMNIMQNIEQSWKILDAKPDFLFFKNSVFVVLIAASDAARREDAGSQPEIAVRVLKVGCVKDLLLRKNFGPNVVFETWTYEKCHLFFAAGAFLPKR